MFTCSLPTPPPPPNITIICPVTSAHPQCLGSGGPDPSLARWCAPGLRSRPSVIDTPHVCDQDWAFWIWNAPTGSTCQTYSIMTFRKNESPREERCESAGISNSCSPGRLEVCTVLLISLEQWSEVDLSTGRSMKPRL